MDRLASRLDTLEPPGLVTIDDGDDVEEDDDVGDDEEEDGSIIILTSNEIKAKGSNCQKTRNTGGAGRSSSCELCSPVGVTERRGCSVPCFRGEAKPNERDCLFVDQLYFDATTRLFVGRPEKKTVARAALYDERTLCAHKEMYLSVLLLPLILLSLLLQRKVAFLNSDRKMKSML